MNLNDYEALWKHQAMPVGKTADLNDLKKTFAAKRQKMEQTILVRNYSEGVGGVLASVGSGLLMWKLSLTGWPITLGLTLMVGVSCVFLHDLWRFHGTRLGPEAPMLAKLEANIAELRHQRGFMSHYGKWYLTSYGTAILFVCYGVSKHLFKEAPPKFLITLLITPSTAAWIAILLIVPIIATVWWWFDIQKTIRLRIEPRIAELEKLRDDLLSSAD